MLTPNNFRSEGSQFFSNYMNPEQPLDQGSFGKLCFTLRSIKSKCWQLQVRNQAIEIFRPSRSLVPSIYLVSHSDWQIRQRRAPSEAPTTGKICRTRKKMEGKRLRAEKTFGCYIMSTMNIYVLFVLKTEPI